MSGRRRTHFVGWDDEACAPDLSNVYRLDEVRVLRIATRDVHAPMGQDGAARRRTEARLVAVMPGGQVFLTGWWDEVEVDQAQGEFLQAWTGSPPYDPWLHVWDALDDPDVPPSEPVG